MSKANNDNINKLHLRLERPEDYDAVEEVAREAFWDGSWEAEPRITEIPLLISRLRDCSSYVPELHYLAELDGKLVGQIIYTTSKVVDDNGTEHEMLTFGPLSVLPECQSQGVGKALMQHTFTKAKKLGYRAVLIFGYPDYYPRAGFRRAAEFGITTSDGKNFDPFMAYPLYDGALDGIKGKYYIDPAYDDLKYDDVVEHDKKFPPKELYIPIPISVLLDRLSPDAQKALEELKGKALKIMTTRSENEISEMEGIDSQAIEVIRTVVKEHGLYWGESRALTE
ncbi:MAG: N-acetyltransferase [Oscillospiraceae bacterium]|nr:N-acetyltransferase [Oscillospiraceae bacterium]